MTSSVKISFPANADTTTLSYSVIRSIGRSCREKRSIGEYLAMHARRPWWSIVNLFSVMFQFLHIRCKRTDGRRTTPLTSAMLDSTDKRTYPLADVSSGDLFFLYNAHSVSFFSRNRSVEIFDSHSVARLPNRSGHHHVRTMYNFQKVTSGDNDATWMRWRCTHLFTIGKFLPGVSAVRPTGPKWKFPVKPFCCALQSGCLLWMFRDGIVHVLASMFHKCKPLKRSLSCKTTHWTASYIFNSFAATFIPQLYSLAPGYFSDVCSAEQWLTLDVHISKTIQDFSLKGWRVGSAAYAHCVRYVRWHTVRCENVSLQHDPTMSPCRVNSPVAANGLCRVNSPVAAKVLK